MKYHLKAVRFALMLALLLAMTCGPGRTAYAAADGASLDFDRTGSVSLTLKDSDGNAVSDGAVTIYQVAVLYLDDGDMAYAYTEDFADCAETLDVEDSSLAAILAEYVTESEISGTAASVDAEGAVSFDGLELGLYLVVQTTQSTGYNTISPFLVTVPSVENDAWLYDVDASPKVEVYTEPASTETTAPETSTTPKTSTTTKTVSTSTLPQTGQLNWPVPVLAVSGLILFATGWLLVLSERRKERHAA
ncbi:MAG: hypothetical protein LUE31_04065 [Lachnospiraceae bacterium]|nr:hypothetical protein [Lachnospiraceae bacterium]